MSEIEEAKQPIVAMNQEEIMAAKPKAKAFVSDLQAASTRTSAQGDENEQQVKNTEISSANEVNKDSQTDKTNSSSTTVNFNSESDLWAEIPPEHQESLRALQQYIPSSKANGGNPHLVNIAPNTAAQFMAQSATQPVNNTGDGDYIPEEGTDSSRSNLPHLRSSVGGMAERSEPETDKDEKPAVGSDEWHKQRRENHKQVERRRRQNINQGIATISELIPQCEKNKGSILNRAAAYIQQLKQNEAVTIEKWTTEKLMADQLRRGLESSLEQTLREKNTLKEELERYQHTLEQALRENNDLKRELETYRNENDMHAPKRLKNEEFPMVE